MSALSFGTQESQGRFRVKLPTKSKVALLAGKYFGQSKVSNVLECSAGFNYSAQAVLSTDEGSPYYVENILGQFSTDHFVLGSPNECEVPISRFRVQQLLHQISEKDGGTVQCPEVGDIYESIARRAPDGTIFCETGFNVGSCAAIFLHGSYGKSHSEVHSFDMDFPDGAVGFLNELYSTHQPRLHAHVGDMSYTIPKFQRAGKFCDVIFLDAKHPEDLQITRDLARGRATLFLYHWHFRNAESKPYFVTSLHEDKTFTEMSCMKTLCDVSHKKTSSTIIRESCFGRLSGDRLVEPVWWHEVI